MGAKNKVGANLERIEMTTHVGTHIDSLGIFQLASTFMEVTQLKKVLVIGVYFN